MMNHEIHPSLSTSPPLHLMMIHTAAYPSTIIIFENREPENFEREANIEIRSHSHHLEQQPTRAQSFFSSSGV